MCTRIETEAMLQREKPPPLIVVAGAFLYLYASGVPVLVGVHFHQALNPYHHLVNHRITKITNLAACHNKRVA